MAFIIGNEHISNQLLSNSFYSNAMDIASFINDGIIFSLGKDLPNSEWKQQWIKYLRIIMPYSGYRVEYSNPFKSNDLKDITDYDIYKGDKFITGERTHSLENAEAQSYIKISQISTFGDFYKNEVDKIKWIIDKIPNFRMYTDVYHKHYRISRDLEFILNNNSFLREWKLSLLLEI